MRELFVGYCTIGSVTLQRRGDVCTYITRSHLPSHLFLCGM